MDWVLLSLAAAVGYLLGSINAAVIVSRLYNKSDVRNYGSGNAGATNMLRTFGKKSAIITSVIDVMKGIVACVAGGLIAHFLCANFGWDDGSCVAGFFAVIGHNWPVYFGFRGGKGVLTAFAVMLMISPLAALCCLAVFVIIVASTRYVSLGSIIAAACLPGFIALFLFVFGKNIICLPFFTAIALGFLVIIRHHSNISRLIKGTESKLSFRRSEKS